MLLVSLLPKATPLAFLIGLLFLCNALDINRNDVPQIMEALQNISHRITYLEASLTHEKDEILGDYRTALAARDGKCSSLLTHLKQNLASEIQKLEATLLEKVSDLETLLASHKAEFLKSPEKEKNPSHCFLSSESIQIFPPGRIPTDFTDDIAEGKNTYASPRYHPQTITYSSEKAVDGQHNTYYHSDKVWNPWWLVDLGSQETIDNIRIITRQDCCYDRFRDVEIRLGNELRIDGDFSSYQLIYFYKGPYTSGDGTLSCSLPDGTKGQFLSIQIVNHLEYLQLETVKVF